MTIFINKGEAPLSVRQAVKRGLRYFNQQKQQYEREQGIVLDDPDYKAWAAQWVTDNQVNGVNNAFNHQLAAYRKALARLAQYKLADGRPELAEEQETGQIDPETGEPDTETVIVQTALEALPTEIEQPVYDQETGEQTGTETVPNPLITQDEAERVAAQTVINATPNEVVEFE